MVKQPNSHSGTLAKCRMYTQYFKQFSLGQQLPDNHYAGLKSPYIVEKVLQIQPREIAATVLSSSDQITRNPRVKILFFIVV